MSTLVQLADRFAQLTVSVLPWLAVGVLAAAAIRVLMPADLVGRVFAGRHGLGAALVTGALVPGCSRSTVPLAMGLRGAAGQRLGTLAVLVFVAPLLSPVTVALTWSMLGWQMTVARVLAALAGAALLGVLINRSEPWFESRAPVSVAAVASGEGEGCGGADCRVQTRSAGRVGHVMQRLVMETVTVGRHVIGYFLAGMILAALITTLLPADAIPDLLGGTAGPAAFLLAAIVGAPISVCQGEEVPITYAVLASGVAAGPALTFLLGSVGLCLPTVVMSRAVLAPRVAPVYLAFWIIWVVLAGAAFQLLSG
jgi:uncharacterized protein